MTYVTCRLTAKNRDQLQNPMLSNRVLATFTFFNFCVTCIGDTPALPQPKLLLDLLTLEGCKAELT